jgi:hypothetical protein
MIPSFISEKVGLECANQVEQTDDDGTVQIYSYKSCNNDSPSELKQCRGLVYAGDRLVLRSFGYTPEYTEVQKISDTLSVTDYTFFPSEEGTLLRVFYVTENEKWYISTHRKLDAFKSKWASAKSFGELFVDSLLEVYPEVTRENQISHLTSLLEPGQAYFFLLRNTAENRLVCHAPSAPTVYHIGTLFGDEFKLDHTIDDRFKKCQKLSFDSWADVQTYVSQIDPRQFQGVIGFTSTGAEIKVLHPKNQLYAEARGNDSNVLYRYLKVRGNMRLAPLFMELFVDQISKFVQVEQLLACVAATVHQAYLARYVAKRYLVVPTEEYRILRECHAFYMENRATNRVTPAVVVQVMSRENMVPVLFAIVKRMTSPPQPVQNAENVENVENVDDTKTVDTIDEKVDTVVTTEK